MLSIEEFYNSMCVREGEVGGGGGRGVKRGEGVGKGEGREETIFIIPFTAQATV